MSNLKNDEKDLEALLDENEEKSETPKETSKTKKSETKKEEVREKSYEERQMEANAVAAMASAFEAQSKNKVSEADKRYAQEKRKHMLERCKNAPKKAITPSKIYAQYFGKSYTFTYNMIPINVKFDSTEQVFPDFVADFIEAKILKVSESNTYKENIENRVE